MRRDSTTSARLASSDSIKVAVRVRPLLDREADAGASTVVHVGDDASTVRVIVPGPVGSVMQREFQFHAALGPNTDQADVITLCGVHQLIDAAMLGYNVTIFAYGQTGSGKTYTMSGKEEVISDENYSGDKHDGERAARGCGSRRRRHCHPTAARTRATRQPRFEDGA